MNVAREISAKAPRIALLIDGENLSPDRSLQILDVAERTGNVLIRRVYGDATRIPGWDAVPGLRLIHAGRGKNASDILLAIDAVELAYADACDGFVIASSDGDFSHVSQRLRERGHRVIGAGENKAPDNFRRSCSEFVQLVEEKLVGEIDARITDILRDNGHNDHSVAIKQLNARMKTLHDFHIGATPEGRWRPYLAGRPHLFELSPPGPDSYVRLRLATPPKGNQK